jgi:hypothetical protein
MELFPDLEKHKDGSIQHAFFISDRTLYWTRLVMGAGAYGGHWVSPIPIPCDISNIAVVNDPTNNQLLAYGVSSKGNFVLIQDKGSDQWTATEFGMNSKTLLTNASCQFVFDGGSWLTYALINNQLYMGKGSLTAPATSLSAAKRAALQQSCRLCFRSIQAGRGSRERYSLQSILRTRCGC